MAPRLLFVVNDASFFLSHRLPLAIAARQAGFDVHVATMPGPGVEAVRSAGFVHHAVALDRSGRNPVRELLSLLSVIRLFRKLRPQLVHLVTIKPVIYGGIAASLTGVPGVVAAVSGLGFLFIQQGWRARILRLLVRLLYRFALGHPNLHVIFQNASDKRLIQNMLNLRAGQISLVRGSGVDLQAYRWAPESRGPVVVTMAARLLKDKGTQEFVTAAMRLASEGVAARFQLVGAPDPGNPATCVQEDLYRWRSEGVVDLLGHRSDIAEIFKASHVVVLPSYREGLPKVLIEAAACGRPVVTTDVPGCRDAILPDVSGKLVPVRDPQALAAAIRQLVEDPELRKRMGSAGRRWAEQEFNVRDVVARHMEIYRDLLRP